MLKNKTLFRVVIDTNLWISFLISKKMTALDTLLFEHKITLLFSDELVNEISQTITKPKLRKYFSHYPLEEMFELFEPYIEFVNVKTTVSLCRDAKDNFLLELAKDGKANFLITGDNDLLDLVIFNGTKILTFALFVKQIT